MFELAIWQFPEEDFAAWKKLTGDRAANYRAYMDVLAAVQADQERQGRTVVRKRFSVAEMRRRLTETGLENTTDNRALITACYPDMPPTEERE